MSHGSDGYGSRTYILYGISDALTIGAIPTFGYSPSDRGKSSSGPRMGDLTLRAQYRVIGAGSEPLPLIALVVSRAVPLGKFDGLGDRPGDGIGAGLATLGIGFNMQKTLRLPTGRPLRLRFNFLDALGASAKLHDVSVYGTDQGFRGHVHQRSSLTIGGAAEYSFSRNWVLAFDAFLSKSGAAEVAGTGASGGATRYRILTKNSWAFVPALEYSWSAKFGVIAGIRRIPRSTGVSPSVTPVVAVNAVL